MQIYLAVFIPFVLGMGLFVLLRRRNANPALSGLAATTLSMVLAIAYFAFVISTGRI